MSLLTWKETYSVQVDEIDIQHKRLIELINHLHDAMSKGQGKDVLGATLGELIEYTKTHFITEELLMQKCQYPHLAEHKTEHELLTQKVIDIQERFNAGQAAITVEVMHFLKSWLTNHILQTDKRYVPYLLKG